MKEALREKHTHTHCSLLKSEFTFREEDAAGNQEIPEAPQEDHHTSCRIWRLYLKKKKRNDQSCRSKDETSGMLLLLRSSRRSSSHVLLDLVFEYLAFSFFAKKRDVETSYVSLRDLVFQCILRFSSLKSWGQAISQLMEKVNSWHKRVNGRCALLVLYLCYTAYTYYLKMIAYSFCKKTSVKLAKHAWNMKYFAQLCVLKILSSDYKITRLAASHNEMRQ